LFFPSEADLLLLVDGANDELFNRTTYPTTFNFNPSPDTAYFRALHVLALEYGWTRITFICPTPSVHNNAVLPSRMCSKADAIIESLKPNQFSARGLFLLNSDEPGNSEFDNVLEDEFLKTSRGKMM
jgi:hypothetical protein